MALKRGDIEYALKALNHMYKSEFFEAIHDYTEAIHLNPHCPELYESRSLCYENLHHIGYALNDIDKAITLSPNSPHRYFRKGQMLIALKEYNEARKLFTHVLELSPNNVNAEVHLEYIRMKMEQLIVSPPKHRNNDDTSRILSDNTDTRGLQPSSRTDVHFDQTTRSPPDIRCTRLDYIPNSNFIQINRSPPRLDYYPAIQVNSERMDALSEFEQKSPSTMAQENTPRLGNTRLKTGIHPAIQVNSERMDALSEFEQKSPSTSTMAQENTPRLGNTRLKTGIHPDPVLLQPISQQHYDEAAQKIQDNILRTSCAEKSNMIWIGNVDQHANREELTKIFSSIGGLLRIAFKPKRWALAEYEHEGFASKAIEKLQGVECGGQYLLIRYLTRRVTPECRFWRSLGCHFGTSCAYRHVPEHHMIEKNDFNE